MGHSHHFTLVWVVAWEPCSLQAQWEWTREGGLSPSEGSGLGPRASPLVLVTGLVGWLCHSTLFQFLEDGERLSGRNCEGVGHEGHTGFCKQ